MTEGLWPTLTPSPDDPPAEPYPGPPPVVAVYGDSFTFGDGPYGWGSANWTVHVRDRLRLAVANNAVSGSGFCQLANRSTFPYAAAVWPVPGASVVVVFGGYNDRNADATLAQLQAVVTVRLLQAAHPGAQVLLVGPQWPASRPSAGAYAIRDSLAAAAAQTRVRHVDPSGWLAGRPDLIASDGVHPNDAGHRAIAERMAPIVADALAAAAGSTP